MKKKSINAMVSYIVLKIIRRRSLFIKRNKDLQKIGKTGEISVCKSKSMSKRCRICLKDGDVAIYGDITDLSGDLCSFTNIDLSQNDDYPKCLCHTCFDLLKGAILLRETAQKTDKLLRGKTAMLLPTTDNENDNHTESIHSEGAHQKDHCIKKYHCKLCNVYLNSHAKYLKHRGSEKHKKYHIKCFICKGVYTSKLYPQHLARHQSEHVVCEICGKLYRKDNLARHQQMHSLKLPFKCPQCPYRSRLMETLKVHNRTHTGVKPYPCDECKVRFLTQSNLNRHKLTHKKERPFKCKQCVRGFYTKRDMEVHHKVDHVGLKEFACRLCGNQYGTRGSMMKHELRVHRRSKMAKGRVPMYLKDEFQNEAA